ncbi:MAG: hypothetical protein J5I65_14850 [Aridibacter famidurans]|nr:hypothetical protein [Aridibacter famidurans]
MVAPTIYGYGKFVAFATAATNAVSGDSKGLQDIFVVEIDSGKVIRASIRAYRATSERQSVNR